jgi:RHH-type proline utilization regulon transcriptional repressor/proline dehydrogenase/delta 1-pyrroline-5-carboxylate dehydrogenase
MTQPPPFAAFAPAVRKPSPLRKEITAAYRRPEAECVQPLLDLAALPRKLRSDARNTAFTLVSAIREKRTRSGVETLVQEFALSSQEGVALMCLAEALLRIPDDQTRDALIRDKIAKGDWMSHVGSGKPLFVNAASWGLVVTGKLLDSVNDRGLAAALSHLLARAGEPVIRRAVDIAMRLMGEQFVTGETIGQALKRARSLEAKGFTYSYDMLGEAAMTAADAVRYYRDYEQAIHAIGKASAGRGIYVGPGVSIKLSALHPRYSRAQAGRVTDELLPRVKALAALAKRHDIGLNIDAEEGDRLELSLDLLESLALDPDLSGWDGLGFAVQAYGKRCPFVIDWIVDLARRANRRIMVRLVKGAYWDTEIKRAQVDGLADFPVYTRKVHTDVAYIACAKKLLAAPDAIFPQFATHNAQTLATIFHIAGPDFTVGDYEFQCLHGMGEPLYGEVVGKGNLDRPCRIYAPVGTHETLLAYLVRRLLENGANSSFVNRVADASVAIDELVMDPVEQVRAMDLPGRPHDQIALPSALYADRRNSAGIDLSDEDALAHLSCALTASAMRQWHARPEIYGCPVVRSERPVCNPADATDVVGTVAFCVEQDARDACRIAAHAAAAWAATPVADRAAMLERAADSAHGAGHPRGRQVSGKCDRRGSRGDRFPALLCGAGPNDLGANATAARPHRLHQPLEFPACDLHGADRCSFGRGQSGPCQTGGRNAADRRRGGAHPSCRGRPGRCAPAAAGRGRDRGRAGWGCGNRGRDLHRLDRGCAPDSETARHASVARWPPGPADCGNGRSKCHDRG